jgi:hypothetical protein
VGGSWLCAAGAGINTCFAASFLGAVIAVQLANRAVLIPLYITLGFGLASLSPQLNFLNQTSAPGFYLHSIVSEQCHFLLVLAMLPGVFLIGRSRPLRYVFLVFWGLLFAYSNLLPAYSVRYFYFYQPLLILGAFATLVEVIKRCRQLVAELEGSWSHRMIGWTLRGIILLVLVVCSTRGLLLYRWNGGSPTDNSVRYGMYWQEARPACEFVANLVRPGDHITGSMSQSYNYFTGKMTDSTPNLLLSFRVIFNRNRDIWGKHENIYTRIPILRNRKELVDLLSEGKRVWFIGGLPPNVDKDTILTPYDYITRHSRMVYASYNSEVYLCERITTRTGEQVFDPSLPPSAMSVSDGGTEPEYVQDAGAVFGVAK